MGLFNIPCFQKFSFSDPDAEKDEAKSILVVLSVGSCLAKLKTYLSSKDLKKLIINDEFNEIYYENNDCEITILLLANENSNTIISSHVASNKFNHSYKELVKTLSDLRELFKNNIKK